jgi:uncharacterized membrane protein YccC
VPVPEARPGARLARILGAVRRGSYARLRRLSGLRYAGRVLVAGAVVWFVLRVIAHTDPLWGLISCVVVTDLKLETAMTSFASRMLNTLIGCAVGLLTIRLIGATPGIMLIAMAAAIIISADVVRVPISWRIAPITTAIVMTPACLLHSAEAGMRAAVERTGDVVLGSAVAVGVSAAAGWLHWRS